MVGDLKTEAQRFIATSKDRKATDLIRRLSNSNTELRECLEEAVDLMEDVCSGDYCPDSLTTQPWRIALTGEN